MPRERRAGAFFFERARVIVWLKKCFAVFWRTIIFFGLTALLVFVLSITVPTARVNFVLAGGAMTTAVVVFVTKLVGFFDDKNLRAIGFDSREPSLSFVIGLALGALWLITTLGVLVLVHHFEKTSVPLARDSWPTLMQLFVGLVLSAAFEELCFRGYWFEILRERFGSIAAVSVTSLGFAIVHAMNPGFTFMAAVNLVLAGVLLAIARLRAGLVFAIALHASWNFTLGPIFGLSVSGNEIGERGAAVLTGPVYWSGGTFGIEASVATSMTATLFAVMLLVSPRSSFSSERIPVPSAGTGP